LASSEEVIGDAKQATVVNEGMQLLFSFFLTTADEYVIIKNPYDPKTKQCRMGQREVRTGPCVLFLSM
jgi:hypothetical protein